MSIPFEDLMQPDKPLTAEEILKAMQEFFIIEEEFEDVPF